MRVWSAITSTAWTWSSGGFGLRGERFADRRDLDRSVGFGEQLRKALWPERMYLSRRECPADQRPAGFDEAERTGTSPTSSRTSSTCLSTPSTSLVQSRRPTSTFSTLGRRMPPSILNSGRALVSLGVDDPVAGRRDGDGVDVRLRSRDAAVVEYGERLRDQGTLGQVGR